MKRISVLLFLINSLWLPAANADEWGYIVKDHYDCKNDHMAINTNSGWLLAEGWRQQLGVMPKLALAQRLLNSLRDVQAAASKAS